MGILGRTRLGPHQVVGPGSAPTANVFSFRSTFTSTGADVLVGNLGAIALTSLKASAAATYHLDSSSADDDGSPAGTGARTVRVWGIRLSDGLVAYEDVITNGTTAVSLSTTDWYTFFYMEVLTCGTDAAAKGNIWIANAADDTFYCIIAAGAVTSDILRFNLPTTCKQKWFWELATHFTVSTTANDSVEWYVKVTQNGTGGASKKIYDRVNPGTTSTVGATYSMIASGEFGPGSNEIYMTKIGTTNQASTFSFKWGVTYEP